MGLKRGMMETQCGHGIVFQLTLFIMAFEHRLQPCMGVCQVNRQNVIAILDLRHGLTPRNHANLC